MAKTIEQRAAVTIGTFDGVHRGHQAILARLGEIARTEGLKRVAYAFVFPPRLAVKGETRGLLLPEETKVGLLERYVERVERARFKEVAHISAQEFVTQILLQKLQARAIVVGEGFRFGRDRSGDVALLREICSGGSVEVIAVPPFIVGGKPVSSTRIRGLIREGNVSEASTLLGRPPLLVGKVTTGDRLGSELGYPTANLSVDQSVLLPKDGIYLVHASWDTGRSPGLLYVGKRPTLRGSEHRCEVHLFARSDTGEEGHLAVGELYGRTMHVHLQRKLREDRRFANLSQLQDQIGRDIELARSMLAQENSPQGLIAT